MTGDSTRPVVVGLWTMAALVAGVWLLPLVAAPAAPAQTPLVFRSAVDLVAVDVQVVNEDGAPIESLQPVDFDVSIGGKRRRVVSAEFLRSTLANGSPVPDHAAAALGPGRADRPDATLGRIYVLVFDVSSMATDDSRSLVAAATTFIDQLLPSDRVGVFVLPVGEHLAPTTNHLTARLRLQNIFGHRPNAEGFNSRFNLSASEVVDINAEARQGSSSPFGRIGAGQSAAPFEAMSTMGGSEAIRAVQIRECSGPDLRCVDEIRTEALSAAMQIEAQGIESMTSIGSVLQLLAAYDRHKTIVLFSAGIPTSDRPGGRPDAGQLPEALGKAAAATNTAIYTLHIDGAQNRWVGAATGRAMGSPRSRARDFALGARVLEEFSAASGGALLRASSGSAQGALDRVRLETSSRYLLGVQPESGDRDGRLRELRVRVRQRGVTVRSRTWLIVPERVGG